MKFVKRISLFFIYPISMFSLGFASNMVLMEYFYPGRGNGNIQIKAAAEEGPEKDTGENTGGFMEGFTGESAKGLAEGASGQPKEGMVEVSLDRKSVV